MKFKGISEVIATLLMLIITIALAGTAYLYISGFFKSKTAVVLTIDEAFSYCNSSHVIVGVRNDGTDPASNVNIVVYNPNGNQMGAGSASSVPAGGYVQVAVSRPSGDPAGYHKVIVSSAVSRGEGVIFCAQ